MKLLVDAQLPLRLCEWLRWKGHDVVHTSSLPSANRTSDAELVRIADDNERVVMTKDIDFASTHLVRGSPRRLLLVSLGNMRNAQLIGICSREWDAIVSALEQVAFVEVTSEGIVLHDT